MKFGSLFEKTYYRFYKYCIAGKNSQCFYKGNICKPTQVIFYLADTKIVHLGDTLWFEPIARFLSGHFSVAVYPIPAMLFYFNKLGYKIVQIDDMSHDKLNLGNLNQSIVIAPIELMFKLRHLPNVLFLSLDYRNVVSGDRLINSVLNAVARYFKLNSGQADAKYHALSYTPEQINECLKKFNLLPDEKYIIFNNYIDSWGKYTTPSMVNESAKKLVDYAKNYKNKNIKFIYTGSIYDKENNNVILDDLIDIDLRGKTTVEDMFILVSAAQTTQYIGFDTFLLHLFNMYNKPSHILLKPGNSDKTNQLIKDGVLVPYLSNKPLDMVLIDND